MRRITLALALAHTALTGIVMTGHSAQAQEVEGAMLTEEEFAEAHAIIQSFAEDYRNDPMAIDTKFGIKLNDRFWSISVTRREQSSSRGRLTDHTFGPHDVTLSVGQPADPTWYFEIADMNVLRLIDSGEINAGTAGMQSFGSDEVGLELRDMEGFSSNAGDEADRYVALSHFFMRGRPEVTYFGRENSLQTHGVQATALHMVKTSRILYFSISSDEAANDDPNLEFSQTPNLFIVTSGRGELVTDNDEVIALEHGVSVFVPQYTRHVIRNDGGEPLEGVLVLYADNSDFAFGTSYPAFIQDLNQFYREYPFGQPQAEPGEGE